jgi:hypothetical protein
MSCTETRDVGQMLYPDPPRQVCLNEFNRAPSLPRRQMPVSAFGRLQMQRLSTPDLGVKKDSGPCNALSGLPGVPSEAPFSRIE